MADTRHDRIHILQHRGVFNPFYILTTRRFQIVVVKYSGKVFSLWQVSACQRNVRKPFKRDLFGMARPCDDRKIFQRDLITLCKIVCNQHVLVRYNAFDGGNDHFVPYRRFQFLQMLLEKRRGGGKNQDVGIFDGCINVRIKIDAIGIERYGRQVTGIMLHPLEIFDRLRTTHIPVNIRLSRQHDFSQRRSPASASHNRHFSENIFHVVEMGY